MGEKLSNSGDASRENETLRQIDLITKISQTSDLLSSYLTEGKTWHVSTEGFGRPPSITLDRYDLSNQLHAMDQKRRDLHVRLQILPEEYVDGEKMQPSCYLWDIYPPGISSVTGETVSKCSQNTNSGGFGLTVFCPKQTQTTIEGLNIRRDLELASVYTLVWYKRGESTHDLKRPENILLDIIKNDPTASLETALWILESLYTAKEIHSEEESFRL